MSTKTAWLIVAQTNIHVGNESVDSYGLIDKAVQRDVVTTLPCINSSSLKGAVNEYASLGLKLDKDIRKTIFGVDKTADKNNKSEANDTQKGDTSFFNADLLALPRPCDGDSLYELATCEAALQQYLNRLKTFGIVLTEDSLKKQILNLNHSNPKPTLQLYPEKTFKDLCSDIDLPIIARNHLDNGKSVNLWYEQVLPRETVFGTLLLSENGTLEQAINGKLIQVGANATVGYGYCQFIQIAKGE